jgi:hypothetical protein
VRTAFLLSPFMAAGGALACGLVVSRVKNKLIRDLFGTISCLENAVDAYEEACAERGEMNAKLLAALKDTAEANQELYADALKHRVENQWLEHEVAVLLVSDLNKS